MKKNPHQPARRIPHNNPREFLTRALLVSVALQKHIRFPQKKRLVRNFIHTVARFARALVSSLGIVRAYGEKAVLSNNQNANTAKRPT